MWDLWFVLGLYVEFILRLSLSKENVISYASL
jgi:hypothetical protein